MSLFIVNRKLGTLAYFYPFTDKQVEVKWVLSNLTAGLDPVKGVQWRHRSDRAVIFFRSGGQNPFFCTSNALLLFWLFTYLMKSFILLQVPHKIQHHISHHRSTIVLCGAFIVDGCNDLIDTVCDLFGCSFDFF